MAINSAFQMVTEDEWTDLLNGKTPMAGDQPLKFIGIVGLRELRNRQIGAIEGLKKALEAREVQAEKIRNDDMISPKAKAVKFEELDAKHAAEISGLMDAVTNMAAEAKSQEVFWSRPAALQRCTFFDKPDDDMKNAVVRGDLAKRVERMPFTGLLDMARYALALQNDGDRKTAAAMTAVLSEEIDARTVAGGSKLSLDNGERRALDAFMDKVDCFDREARRLVAEMEVSAKECMLLGNDRKGTSAAMISVGLQRHAVDQMPAK